MQGGILAVSKNRQLKAELKRTREDAVTVIAAEIKLLSDSIKRLRAGELNERAIITLIHDAEPNIGKTEIKAVLNAVANLPEYYLRKIKDSEKK